METERIDSTQETRSQTAQLLVPKLPKELKLSQEAEWAKQASQGDRDALGKLYEIYANPVFGYFYKRTESKFEAETLTSETFFRALEALARGHYVWQGKPFGAWLFGIASKVLKEHRRNPVKQLGTEEVNNLSEDKEPVSKEKDPLDLIVDREKRDALWELVGKLQAVEQQILEMRYKWSLSHEEIAEEFGRSVAACKQLHYRALQKLRKLMQETDLKK